MDIEAVRTFVAVADAGQFQDAADDLRITQQAVSKRIAKLERSLGVTVFARTPRGVRLTLDGRSFLPHARGVLRAVEGAVASVRPGQRALRVDVLNRRIAPAQVLRGFYEAHPGFGLEVVTLPGATVTTAVEALLSGEIDATFRAVPGPLPAGIVAERVLDDRLQLMTGPAHPLADAPVLSPAELAPYRIWIPGLQPGSEWAAFYAELAAAFGLRIDGDGPNFGSEALMDTIAAAPDRATLVGTTDRYVWPPDHDLRRIPVRGPAIAYPHSLLSAVDNPHPALAALRRHLTAAAAPAAPDVWTPSWR